MNATATPATVAPRMGMLGGVLRGAGARIGTDEELPSEFQLWILKAQNGEKAAQDLANAFGLDLAVAELHRDAALQRQRDRTVERDDALALLADTRQALFDMTVQRDALLAENVAARPVLDVVARDVHRGTASGDLWGAYTTYTEGGL